MTEPALAGGLRQQGVKMLRISTPSGVLCFDRMSDKTHVKWGYDHTHIGKPLDVRHVAHINEFRDADFYPELSAWVNQ